MAKKGLGRGLSALIRGPQSPDTRSADQTEGDGERGGPVPVPISGVSAKADDRDTVRHVALSRVSPSPFQPRQRFSDEHLESLMESIREKGVIQPLIVREVEGGNLELIAGERRWRASRKLNLDEVPVIVREASDQEVLEMALIENLQREDLNPIEEADAYARLAQEFGLKQEEIAQRVGKNRTTVANMMRLLDLEKSVRSLVAQAMISAGHAKAILGLKTGDEQKLIADIVLRKKLNVRATEKLVSDHIAGRRAKDGSARRPGGSKPLDPVVRQLQDRLKQRFSTNVQLQHSAKKGKIEIEYYGNEDLDRILNLLGISPE